MQSMLCKYRISLALIDVNTFCKVYFAFLCEGEKGFFQRKRTTVIRRKANPALREERMIRHETSEASCMEIA